MNQTYENGTYTAEREFFGEQDLSLKNCSFDEGESPFKETRGIKLDSCRFTSRYPLWYAKSITAIGCDFTVDSRAGTWYSEDISMENCVFEAPKCFRKSKRIRLTGVEFKDCLETLWECDDLVLTNVTAKGEYFFKGSNNAVIENLTLNGKYSFDGCRNITIRNSYLKSKDFIWNCENITLENCEIDGEYIGWNSKNVRLTNCKVKSLQGFCYIDNLVLENCSLAGTSLAFEYSTVDAVVTDGIDSVINPSGGRIVAKQIDKLILDPTKVDPSKTIITAAIGERLEHFDGIIPAIPEAALEAAKAKENKNS